jgi:predicted transcriptional regulator
MQHLTLEQFRATVEAGAVMTITLKAHGAAFAVQAETRRGEAVLVDSRRKEPRMFTDPRKAMMLLRDMGIRSAKMDATSWQPEQADLLRKSRPAAAEQMKAMHEAAEHDKWFKAQVEIGLADMQAGRVVSAEAASSRWADKRAELLKKAEAHASS